MKPNVINQMPPDHQKMERSSGSTIDTARYLKKASAGLCNQGQPVGLVSLAAADLSALSVTASTVGAKYFPKFGLSGTGAQRFSRIQTEQGNTYELMNTLSDSDGVFIFMQHERSWQGKTTIAQGVSGTVRFARNTNTNEIVAVKKMASVLGQDGQVIENRARAEHEIKQIQLIQSRVIEQNAWSMMDQFAMLQDYAHVIRPVKGLDASTSVASSRPQGSKTYIFSEYASLGDGVDLIGRMHKLRLDGQEDEALRLLNHVGLSYTKAVRDLHRLGLHHRDIKPDNFLHFAAQRPMELEHIKLADFGFTHDEAYRTQWAGETAMYAPPECKPGYRSARYDALAHDSFSLGLSLLVLKNQEYPYKEPRSPHLYLKTIDGQIQNLTLKFYRNLGESGSEKVRCMGVGSEYLKNLDMSHFDNIIAKLIATNKVDRITAEQAYDLFSQSGEEQP